MFPRHDPLDKLFNKVIVNFVLVHSGKSFDGCFPVVYGNKITNKQFQVTLIQALPIFDILKMQIYQMFSLMRSLL